MKKILVVSLVMILSVFTVYSAYMLQQWDSQLKQWKTAVEERDLQIRELQEDHALQIRELQEDHALQIRELQQEKETCQSELALASWYTERSDDKPSQAPPVARQPQQPLPTPQSTKSPIDYIKFVARYRLSSGKTILQTERKLHQELKAIEQGSLLWLGWKAMHCPSHICRETGFLVILKYKYSQRPGTYVLPVWFVNTEMTTIKTINGHAITSSPELEVDHAFYPLVPATSIRNAVELIENSMSNWVILE